MLPAVAWKKLPCGKWSNTVAPAWIIAAPLAQEIVTQMKEIIHQETNFMNKQAIIVASTDYSRIGESHGGAEQIIKTRQPLTIDTDYSYI